jgi:hypothetical protein
LVLFLILLQFVHLFCNQSKCILLFFSCISSLLLLFFCNLLHFKTLKSHTKTLKIRLYMFRSPLKPSSR